MRGVCLLVACLVGATSAPASAASHRVFVAGDSTASAYGPERAPREGWGMRLQALLDPTMWDVRNHAQSGRSSRSFVEQGWLDAIDAGLQPGDVLLIQFGHNDEKVEDPARYTAPRTEFPAWLMKYVALARRHGATPILITPLARRRFEHGQLLDTHGAYAQAVRDLAAGERVGLIDLDAMSTDWLRSLGDEPSRAYFMHVPEARTPDQPQADDTHLRDRGARAVACLILRGWRALDPTLAVAESADAACAVLDRAAP